MKAEQYQGKGLTYLNIYPDDYDPGISYPLIVMLHGFGANMKDLAGLAPAIHQQGYVYSCPNAPIPFDLGLGMIGYGWYPPRGQATNEEIAEAERLVSEYFDEVFDQLKGTPGQIVLLGFSQGGGMTYRCGIGRPDTFAGLVALSASLPDPEVLKPRLPDHRKQPIFIAHGHSDPMVAMDTARAARGFLENEGYHPDYHEYQMGHEIPPAVLNDMIPWLTEVLPPMERG